jgi:hypothetical protein
MTDETEAEVPEGAAVFPFIPPELGVNPLLLAALHATVFLAGSEENIVHPAAADEAVQAIAGYFARLEGADLDRVREDMACMVAHARQEKWPKHVVHALKTFLGDIGVEGNGAS